MPPPNPPSTPPPSSPSPTPADPATLRLERQGTDVLARTSPDATPEPVRLVWLRPVHGAGGAFSVITRKRKELALVPNLETLDPASREVARQALAEQYLVPVITEVYATESKFGARIWDVETDHGRRRFSMKDPHIHATWVTPDQLVLRDAAGNRYAIPSFAALPPASRANIARML